MYGGFSTSLKKLVVASREKSDLPPIPWTPNRGKIIELVPGSSIMRWLKEIETSCTALQCNPAQCAHLPILSGCF